ncbi:helix-turn-helix domain-containing protein [Pseudoalteromonas sp. P1-8]|uniref:helix-turn-helix domain-containing protein n=1 Tax=Pseudoalteromonas sp. P1-8 TaxID=1710353 RepID=UPI0006DD1D52|nr:helix-turn-helix transcriptional regulator [Pseudoalteromonas sp. P1-8]KPW03632.1 Helix-turn-helix domain protein [Pseudoalteromonas sp. P1-8]
MFQNPIPIRLKQARTKSGISQKQLGILIGIDESSASGRMNHYEKGRHIPDLTTLKKVADELNVPLSYFLCEDETTAELIIEISKLDTDKKLELIKELKRLSK